MLILLHIPRMWFVELLHSKTPICRQIKKHLDIILFCINYLEQMKSSWFSKMREVFGFCFASIHSFL